MQQSPLKESRFNIVIPNKEGTFVFNALSKSLIHLNGEEKLNPSEQLKGMGFFIEEGIDEDELVRYWLHKRQFSKELALEILGTNNCNLRCEYCLAYYRRNRGGMADQKLEETLQWIQGQIKETNPKRVRLVFSGGEPTLKVSVIEAISLMIKDKFPKVEFDFGIITNGTTLNKPLIGKLSKLGLSWVQITLDGPKKTHDKRRPMAVRGASSYDLIVKNLEVCGGLLPKIYVRVNLDYDNKDSVQDLLVDLKRLPEKTREKLYLQFARVIEMKRDNDLKRNQKRIKQYNYEAAKWEVECYQLAKNEGFNLSISLENIFDPHGPCMFMSRNSFIITPQGNLHKCIGLVRNNNYAVGNVKNGLNSNAIDFAEKGVAFTENTKCKKCKFMPVCYGGCRNLAMLDTGDLWAENCPRDYFSNCSLELIKVLYE